MLLRLIASLLLFSEICCAQIKQYNTIDTVYAHVHPFIYIKTDTTIQGVLINHPRGEYYFYLQEDSVEQAIQYQSTHYVSFIDKEDSSTTKGQWITHIRKFIWDTVIDTLQAGDISNYLDAQSLDYQHEIRLKYILDRMGMSPAKDDICLIHIQDDFSGRSDRVQKAGVKGFIFNKKEEGGYELEVYHGASNNVDGLKPSGNEKYSCTEKQAQRLTQMFEYTTFPDSANILTRRVENMIIVVAHNKAYFVPDRDDDNNKNAFIYSIECLKWEFELLAKRLQKKTK